MTAVSPLATGRAPSSAAASSSTSATGASTIPRSISFHITSRPSEARSSLRRRLRNASMSQRRTQGTKSTASTSPGSIRRLRLNAAIPETPYLRNITSPTSRDTSRSPSWVPIGKPWRLSSWGVISLPGRHSSSAPRTRMLSKRRGQRGSVANGPSVGSSSRKERPLGKSSRATAPPTATITTPARSKRPSAKRSVNGAPSARGGSTAATSHSTRSSTPAAAQAARRQSSTDAALFASGYKRPSPSSRHISPWSEKNPSTPFEYAVLVFAWDGTRRCAWHSNSKSTRLTKAALR